VSDGVAVVTLNRPEAMNAFDSGRTALAGGRSAHRGQDEYRQRVALIVEALALYHIHRRE
jgi:enoyl-CoA hydratase/carnithine racemase